MIENCIDIIAPYGVLVGWLCSAYIAYIGYTAIKKLERL